MSATGAAFTIMFFDCGAPFGDGDNPSKLDTPTWVAVDKHGHPVATLATQVHREQTVAGVPFDRCVTTFALASTRTKATAEVVRAAQSYWLKSHQLTLYRTGTASEKGAACLSDLGIDIAPFRKQKYEQWRAREDQLDEMQRQQPESPRGFNGDNPYTTLTDDQADELREKWLAEAEALLKVNPTGYP
ncbi:hypothetical protein CH278_23945 [Rhodococcus sp. 05-2254-5]|uniref:hypothetical protein n=1 Tax=unclassified Rhodococcus (in: high G+C Gram-positive bacteria) TaxID=192944 RepID=UPI000B9A6358|nr:MULTISPECIES: hypothetical protein [unclassified Rhodococcus (in: high G+C Gram-positive bacteria)]OZE28473.1 hypothetical protein CH278_23945 [Rhodococcus sp. 05-2254-5]OZE38172.1 hypothetical protein CH256_07700 [Rhodococcus sp. 05-2254-6]OZE57032.1 hypothetical protein CH269_13715 [Rhodococcus sp. 05-2254-1]OZE72343.1 hypothetical protein CH305_28440 [Rhodococcus sp. 15-649-2-2]